VKNTYLIILFISLNTISFNSYSDIFSTAIIKLYSDGKVVGQWEAINDGHTEGQCFVFKTKNGIHTPQVRVCGTFSVENKK